MAQKTDSLVIDVSVNSNDVVKFFELMSEKLNQLLGFAQEAGAKLDALGEGSDGIKEVSSSINEAGQNAKKTSKDLENVGTSGKKAGRMFQRLQRMHRNLFLSWIRWRNKSFPPLRVTLLRWPLCLVPNSCLAIT